MPEVAWIEQNCQSVHKVSTDATDFEKGKLNLLTVYQAKGLEFDTVYVLLDEMLDNECYVACTRALKELIVLTSDIE